MHEGDGNTGGTDGWLSPPPPPGAAGIPGPPAAWPDGTPVGGPPPVTAPPAWGPPAAAPPVPGPPAWGPPGGPWGGAPTPPTGPGPRPSRGRSLLAGLAVLLAVVAVAVAVVMADPMGVRTDETAVGWREDAADEDLAAPADRPADPTTTTTETPTTTQPPTTTTAPPARLAPAPTPPAESGFHSFIGREGDGDPIAWDPCETIQYVVNSRLAPPGAAEIVAEALGQVTAASGLVFEDRGPTDEPPSAERSMRDEARYGEGWSPVLVAWTDAAEQPELAERIAGVARPWEVSTSHGEAEYVTGEVHLDGPDFQGLLADGRRSEAVRIVMHEIGHLVGLDHVDDTTQVMYHNRDGMGSADAAWGVGDLGGLAAAGSGDCDPDF